MSAADVARWFEQHQNKLFAPKIRMFLGSTEVNTTIVDTLLSSPRAFWCFNNGIRALCRIVKKNPIGGATRETGIFECYGLHVVNGAQRVGAIADAAMKKPDAVANACVPFRIISLEHCPSDFDKKVTRYNNTQNRIDRRDFVALDIDQERIRGELLLEGVTYIYKSGETLTPSDKGFGLEEATVARACLQPDASLAVQAKREIGKLWEEIEKAPYKTLFNPSVSGPSIWRAVQIVRKSRPPWQTFAAVKRAAIVSSQSTETVSSHTLFFTVCRAALYKVSSRSMVKCVRRLCNSQRGYIGRCFSSLMCITQTLIWRTYSRMQRNVSTLKNYFRAHESALTATNFGKTQTESE